MTGDNRPRTQPHVHDAGRVDTTLGPAVTRYLKTARLSPEAKAAHRSTLLRFAFHVGLDVPVDQVSREAMDDFLWTSKSHGGTMLSTDLVALRSFKRWCTSRGLAARGIAAGLRGRS